MTKFDNSISIIMPAYNEAKGIYGAYESTKRSIQKAGIGDYEILITTNISPSGTHDGTPDVVDKIAKNDSHVKHIFHNKYAGLGFKYRDALNKAQKKYAMMVPGDNDTIESSLVNILKNVGKFPAIVVYTSNSKARPFYIRAVSRSFVFLCNLLFGLRMKYYNGMCVFPIELLKIVPTTANNPAYMAETLIYLLKSGLKYTEMPQEIKYTPLPGKTFRLKSVWDVLITLTLLFWKINIKRVRLDISKWI
ncbi:glycosyltransferase family 2 protein [Patescibacteria group bacterium]